MYQQVSKINIILKIKLNFLFFPRIKVQAGQ